LAIDNRQSAMLSMSRDEVRAVDACAIEEVGISGVVLMENAGRQAADAVEELLRASEGGRDLPAEAGTPPKAGRIAVVAGAGNNGGDGFVVARHLGLRRHSTATFLVARPGRIAGDAAVNLGILRKLGHDVREVDEAAMGALAEELRKFDVVVDAVGGTGIRGPLRGAMAVAVEQINAAGRPVVAIDIPTGLDCDTGEAAGPVVRAAVTVAFVARKKGFDAPGAAAYTGEVRLADIGVPGDIVGRLGRSEAPLEA
jgi:NAD(P)H-hydrate epimerase